MDHTGLLVDHGADATVQDADKAIPFDSSVQEGSTNLAHLTIEESEEMTAQVKHQSTPLYVKHGAQNSQGRLRRVMHPFLDALEIVLAGLLFCWLVNLKSHCY